eukprot:g16309.t1
MEKEEPTLSRRDTHGPFARMGLGSKTSSKASMGGAGAEENERLHCVITEKDAAITALQFEVQRLSNELASHTRVAKREHPLEPVIHLVDEQGSGRPGGHMGRTASMATATALSSLQPGRKHDEMAQRVIRMFKTPKEHATYLTSVKFARDMLRLCARAGPIFENEPRCLFIQSPVYVFGDIHGNLEDLNFFADNIWKLGMNLTAGKFLFLGDYVDRGMSGLECLAYLFALKIENPDKIFMLRGNHELRDVNGWVEHYGERSFLWQCQDRFGDELGEEVWEGCNAVFDRLPLASVIDHDIFCVHGGIPRPLPESTSRVQVINRSSKYKNRYIHRRDSLSLAALSLDDRDKLTRIGVVTNNAADGVPEDVEEYDEEDDEEEEEDEGGGSAESGGAGQDNGKESGDAHGGSGKGVVDMETGASANSRDTFDGYYDQRVDYSSEDEGKGHR